MAEEFKVNVNLRIYNGKRVLFAEAPKDFVDFLVVIMKLPLGAIAKLFKEKEKVVGCLGDLYKSIESLRNDCWLDNVTKDAVLNPAATVSIPLLSIDRPATKTVYRCYKGHKYISTDPKTKCQCDSRMSIELKFVDPESSKDIAMLNNNKRGGYVKETLTYIVMDNLEIKHSSDFNAIDHLKKWGIISLDSVDKRVVQVGLNEGVAILKASLETQAVLSTVFLGKQLCGFEPSKEA